MYRIFGPDSLVMIFLRRVTDLVLLNMLYVICSLSIITAGAATSALYYVTLKMVRNEESMVAQSFFRSFKENLKQTTVMTLLFLFGGVLLFLEVRVILMMEGGRLSIFLGIFAVLIVLLSGIALYTFPLQARFINPVAVTLKNALLLSIQYFPSTLWMLFLNLLPLIIVIFSWNALAWIIPVWLFFAPAGIAYLCSLRFVKILCLPDKDETPWT